MAADEIPGIGGGEGGGGGKKGEIGNPLIPKQKLSSF